MEQNGWRTVIVGNGEHLSLRDGCQLIPGTNQQAISLLQIREVIIERLRGSISLALLDALSSNQISVLLCSEKASPSGEQISISGHVSPPSFPETVITGKERRPGFTQLPPPRGGMGLGLSKAPHQPFACSGMLRWKEDGIAQRGGTVCHRCPSLNEGPYKKNTGGEF